eukprot:10416898-Karenia_brevis.AAC.1
MNQTSPCMFKSFINPFDPGFTSSSFTNVNWDEGVGLEGDGFLWVIIIHVNYPIKHFNSHIFMDPGEPHNGLGSGFFLPKSM